MRVYIAGPMTGIPEFNFPAFYAAAAEWRAVGWEVVNPAESFDGATDRPYHDYIRKDVADLLTVGAIAFLPGWEKSKGARLEHAIGKALKLELYNANGFNLAEPAESICAEADRLVSGDRQADYGHPIEDFTRTGRMWGAILGLPEAVPPDLVALCMVAVKLSRECHRPKRDNRVDGCGYLKTLDMVRERQGQL